MLTLQQFQQQGPLGAVLRAGHERHEAQAATHSAQTPGVTRLTYRTR